MCLFGDEGAELREGTRNRGTRGSPSECRRGHRPSNSSRVGLFLALAILIRSRGCPSFVTNLGMGHGREAACQAAYFNDRPRNCIVQLLAIHSLPPLLGINRCIHPICHIRLIAISVALITFCFYLAYRPSFASCEPLTASQRADSPPWLISGHPAWFATCFATLQGNSSSIAPSRTMSRPSTT